MTDTLRHLRGGLTTEQLASLPPEILEARARYIKDTDAEIQIIRDTFPALWHPRKWYAE
jgi:hypothetical protein